MLTRRAFLGGGAAAVLGLAAWPRVFRARRQPTASTLRPDPAGVLDLPEGFSYRMLDRQGMPMSDGYRVPGKPDGMACFAGPRGSWVLMRNHELSPGDLRRGPYLPGQGPHPHSYRADGVGGVSRLVLDAQTLTPRASNLVLVGTSRNCAGGPSPWGWLSCEESTLAGHGYVFLCPTDASGVVAPQPLLGYGRFNHEAVAIGDRHIAYLTEDRVDGCMYRFLPHDPGRPFEGRLQAMVVQGHARFDTSLGLSVGDRVAVGWVDVDGRERSEDDLRHRAQAAGAARVCRGEGIWSASGRIYLSSTSGGPLQMGQIFRLDPGGDPLHGQDVLTLLAQGEQPESLEYPDNLTVAPWGDLYIAEDGAGEQYLRVLGPDGSVRELARNALSRSELAGLCFSPDGSTLFVNLQHDGLTLAIRGPFQALRATDRRLAHT